MTPHIYIVPVMTLLLLPINVVTTWRLCKREKKTIKFGQCYPALVALTTLVVGIIIVMSRMDIMEQIVAMLLVSGLIVLSAVDFRFQILPDLLNKSLIGLGLLVNYFAIFIPFKTAIIGALAGYWSLWLLNTTFRLIRKKEGMGYGDFKLFAVFGAWFGYMPLPFIIVTASLIGIGFAVIQVIKKKGSFAEPYPFGPAIAIAGFLHMIYDLPQFFVFY